MNAQELINTEAMSLWYHPSSNFLHHKIKQRLPKGAFEELLSTGAECLEKKKACKWLSDDSNVVAISQEDSEYGDKVWAPRVIKAGFKYWAVVLPKSAVGSLQVKRFINEYRDKGVTVEAFDSLSSATAWLDSK